MSHLGIGWYIWFGLLDSPRDLLAVLDVPHLSQLKKKKNLDNLSDFSSDGKYQEGNGKDHF